jgi:hypothetical protein
MAAMPFWMARWVRLPKPRTSCGEVVAWVERKVLIPYRPEDKEKSMQHTAPNPVLRRLDALVGEWEMHASVGGQPMGRSHTAFEWLEGGAFLVQHADAEPDETTPPEWVANSPLPLTTIIGLDDSAERYCMLYADARGVFRVYQMSLSDGVWKLWRDAPGFFQRFTGTFSGDGKTISGRWEGSRDGSNWEYDFDVTYTKVK